METQGAGTNVRSLPDDAGFAEFIASFDGHEIIPHLVRLIARGRPAGIDEISAASGWPAARVEAMLRNQGGTEWQDDGKVVGFGLTLRPTRHRMTVHGYDFFTWCASDALFFPLILGAPAKVESTCPATGERIRIEVQPDTLSSVSPAQAVVSQLHRPELFGDIHADICDQGYFFATASVAEPWITAHPDGVVLPVQEAFARLRAGCERLGWLGSEAG